MTTTTLTPAAVRAAAWQSFRDDEAKPRMFGRTATIDAIDFAERLALEALSEGEFAEAAAWSAIGQARAAMLRTA